MQPSFASKTARRWGEPGVFLLLTYGTIVYWLRRCWLSPDSTNYLTAAFNLLRHGQMFVFTNWPSTTYEPVTELYKLQPFGFPFYLIPFIWVIQDPFLAAVIAQSCAIALFYLGLWQLTRQMKLKPPLQFSLLLMIVTFGSFAQTFGFLWTETLFMGLTMLMIAAIHRSSALAALLLLLTASLRFVGIFNLAFFIPALLTKKLGWRAFLGLSGLALLPNVLWHFRNRWVSGSNFEDHYGWNFSNQALLKAMNVFRSLKYSLAFDSSWVFGLLIVLLGILAWKHLKLRKNTSLNSNRSLTLILLAGTLAHFLGLSAIALVSEIGNLIQPDLEQARLLATVYLLFFLCVHAALNSLSKKTYLVGVLLFVVLLGNRRFVSPRSRLEFVPYIDYPAEYYLWPQLLKTPSIRQASHFYSDYDFTHQVFSEKIQRILWQDTSPNRARLEKLLSVGQHPFFVIQDKSIELNQSLEKHRDALGLKKLEFPELKYRVYYSE